MVGSLIALGMGRLGPEGLLRIRDAFDRAELAACAPPHGLCLMEVAYTPEECDALLAKNPAPPSF
jgi:tRNA U38,U39,U40 pseudouridine synthase TruA